MRPKQHLILGIALAVCLALGAVQGQRLDKLRDATKFYRWMISAATQARLFGNTGFTLQGEDGPEYVDEQLFTRLVEVTEPRLPDPPSMGESDVDDDGDPLPKIVRYSNLHSESGAVDATLDDAEILKRDRDLWALAQNNEQDVAALRNDFLTALREGQLYGVGEQVSLETFYNQTADFGVSLSNMFFGFRKMAANLVWLEVDKFFHSGMQHRMIPAMQTTVALDPSFVDAYLLGAWHLAYNFTAKLTDTPWELREFDERNDAWVGPKEDFYYEGVAFLKDGIRKNPREYKLYFDLGYAIYYEKLNDNHNAVMFLREAIRPAHDVWVRRQLYRIMSLNGQYEESIAGWEWYMDRYPHNPVAPRLRKQSIALLHEQNARHAGVRADAADQLAELQPQRADQWRQAAEAARQEQAQYEADAIEIWTELESTPGSGDTFAVGRRYRRDALLKAEQGRYTEAIAMLDVGRWESNPFWEEASELMIEYKDLAGEPLTVSELKAKRRVEDRNRYIALTPKSRYGVLYTHREGYWKPRDYTGQEVTDIQPETADYYQLAFDHPETAKLAELGGTVVFKAGDDWYRYHGEPLENVIDPYARG